MSEVLGMAKPKSIQTGCRDGNDMKDAHKVWIQLKLIRCYDTSQLDYPVLYFMLVLPKFKFHDLT